MFFLYIIFFLFLLGLVKAVQLWWYLRKIIRSVRFGQDEQARNRNRQYGSAGVYNNTKKDKADNAAKKKVIDDDEGEYVEFEEVK